MEEEGGDIVIDLNDSSSSSSSSDASVGRFHSDEDAAQSMKEGRYRVLPGATPLGKGEFSSVVVAHDGHLDANVALKIVRADSRFTDSTKEEILRLRELMTLRADAPDYFTPLLDSFTFNEHVVLVLPVYDGDLYQHLKKKYISVGKVVPLEVVRTACRNVLRGLQVLHDTGFVHSDLKLDNVLVRTDSEGSLSHVVLADFGACHPKGDAQDGFAQTSCYRDPSLVLGDTLQCKNDLWSFAVGIFYEMLFDCRQLFRCDDDQEYLRQVQNVFGRFPTNMRRRVEGSSPPRGVLLPPLPALLARLVPENDAVRETIVNVMLRCCKYNMRQRASASSLLRDPFFAQQ